MRALVLNTLLQRATAAVFMFTLLLVAACGEDEPEVDPVTVQFTNSAQTITEDGGAKNITLSLSSAAKKDGTISLSVSPANANTFATFPAEITVTKGSTSAQFTITPINNAIIDAAAKIITFTLEDATSGFELGTTTTHAVTITDDEGPTTANFTTASGTVAENANAGLVVAITLSPAADVAGEIEVTMTPSDATVTTTPAATAGIITVPVAVGQETVSFTVMPTNNTEDGDDFDVAFEITDATGGVNVGTNVDYTLTVTDDDDIVPTPIADIRALYAGSDVVIDNNTYIQGVVVSKNDNLTSRNIFIQDATGSIALKFVTANTFAQGDELLINIGGVTLTHLLSSSSSDVNLGPLLIGTFDASVPNANANKVGTATLPAAEEVTLTQLNSGDYEGKLVSVSDVYFPDADGIVKLLGSRNISDGSVTGVVRTENYSTATWKDTAMPLGSGAIKGIASSFNGVSQIIPMSASDIFENNPVGIIGTTGALVDFGSVNNGSESATAQSYTVQGTTLNSDIIITASAGFKISLVEDGSYGSAVTVLAANANAETPVYVKFAPTTGVNQAVAGTITHKSQGAVSVTINITGTESGNEASSLLLIEDFEYGTVAGNVTAFTTSWTPHSGAGSNQVLYTTTSLSMAGYPGSGEGGAAQLRSPIGSEDINRGFTAQTTGVVYVAALINLSAAAASSPGYFYHVSDGGTSNFGARFFAQDEGSGKFKLGMSKRGTPTVFPATGLDYNVTYIVVIKYVLDGNPDNSNDVASFYLLTAPTSTEPSTPTQTDSTGGDFSVSSVAIRQASGCPPGATIDGIRVASTWADLFN
jgi:hypothetical protein